MIQATGLPVLIVQGLWKKSIQALPPPIDGLGGCPPLSHRVSRPHRATAMARNLRETTKRPPATYGRLRARGPMQRQRCYKHCNEASNVCQDKNSANPTPAANSHCQLSRDLQSNLCMRRQRCYPTHPVRDVHDDVEDTCHNDQDVNVVTQPTPPSPTPGCRPPKPPGF